MNSTEAKVMTFVLDEMTKTDDLMVALWKACHKINDEAVAKWGQEWDGKAFAVAANIIQRTMSQAMSEVTA